MPQKEVTEFLYASNQIVCVKDDKGGSEITLVLACLQENAKVGLIKVMAQIFVRDPFNPICFSEDPEKYIEEESIICILTSNKHKIFWNLNLLQDEIQ